MLAFYTIFCISAEMLQLNPVRLAFHSAILLSFLTMTIWETESMRKLFFYVYFVAGFGVYACTVMEIF